MVAGRTFDFNCTIDEDEFKSEMARTSFRRAVLKVLHAMRVSRLGRRAKRSKEYLKRNRTFQLWDAPNNEEQTFVTAVMNSVPLMRRTSKLLRPLCDAAVLEDCTEVPDLAAEAIHECRVWTTRIAYRESKEAFESLSSEASKYKRKYESLQTQFHGVRGEYLKEVSALRDAMRVRGDPENAIWRENLDVTFFLDPMNLLQQPELDFALKVVSEKLKMIFETNPSVSKTVDFGQVDKLKDLAVSKEVTTLKEALEKKVAQVSDLQKELAQTQRRLSIESGASLRAAAAAFGESMSEPAGAETTPAAAVPDSQSKLSGGMVDILEDKISCMRESQRETEKALQQQYRVAEVLTLERDEREQALQESERVQKSLREQVAESAEGTRQLKEQLLESAAKQHRQAEQIQSLLAHNQSINENNGKLKKMVQRARTKTSLQDKSPTDNMEEVANYWYACSKHDDGTDSQPSTAVNAFSMPTSAPEASLIPDVEETVDADMDSTVNAGRDQGDTHATVSEYDSSMMTDGEATSIMPSAVPPPASAEQSATTAYDGGIEAGPDMSPNEFWHELLRILHDDDGTSFPVSPEISKASVRAKLQHAN